LLPQQAGASQKVFFHVSRPKWTRPHNVIFGWYDFPSLASRNLSKAKPMFTDMSGYSATNSNEFYGPMKSTDMPLILLCRFFTDAPIYYVKLTLVSDTSSVSEVSWKVSEVVHELVMSRVGEEEGGVALMEVAFDAPGIAHEDLGWIYSVDGAPTLVVIDPKWSDPMDEARLTDTAKLLDREFLKEFIKDIARRGKEIRDGGDQK
jgi:hypothetical protein